MLVLCFVFIVSIAFTGCARRMVKPSGCETKQPRAPKVTITKAPKKSAKHAARKGGSAKVAHARKAVPARKIAATKSTKKIVLAQKPR